MRHILVDYARARNAQKRPDGNVVVSLSDVDVAAPERESDLVALDEALSRLEQIDPRASRVVELRFFTGLTERETAEAMDMIGVEGNPLEDLRTLQRVSFVMKEGKVLNR